MTNWFLSNTKDYLGVGKRQQQVFCVQVYICVCSYIYLCIDLSIFSCTMERTWKLQSACPECKYWLCHYLAVLLWVLWRPNFLIFKMSIMLSTSKDSCED